MKKYLFAVLILVLTVGISFTGCRKVESGGSSDYLSVIEQNEEIIESVRPSQVGQLNTVLQSSVPEPECVNFYKGGKYFESADKNINVEVASHIEKWFKDVKNLETVSLSVGDELITDIICNETAVELVFGNVNSEINMLNTFTLEKTNCLMVALTGDYKYLVFVGYGGRYKDNPYRLEGSGLEKYFEGLTFDKKVQDWQSTVAAPITVNFYKDGMQAASYNKELNLKIARKVEEQYKYEKNIGIASLAANTDLINNIKRNETAVELIFDCEIKLYGGIIKSNTRTLFISLSGEHYSMLFSNTVQNPDDWSSPMGINSAEFEQFFDFVEFTPLSEEQKRWRSTVATPFEIKFYENGNLIGETNSMVSYPLNSEIARKIESWFYKKDNIRTVNVALPDLPLEAAWRNGKYMELYFSDDITFYGENIISKEYNKLCIPLDNDYAYCIFTGNSDGYSNVAYDVGGSSLEPFFEEIKNIN